jgi:hypothetical protein
MMTERDNRSASAFEQRLAALDREIEPQRDLWPGIAARIGQRPAPAREQRSPWRFDRWFPVGAALVGGYLLASWFPLPWVPGQSAPDSQAVQAPPTLLVGVQPALAQLPANTRAVVAADLSGLEQDWLSIEAALVADPDNELLRELRQTAQNRAESVREQVNRVTASVSEAIDI